MNVILNKMMYILKYFYRKIVPIRVRILIAKKRIIKYLEKYEDKTEDIVNYLKFGQFYPFDFMIKYNVKNTIIHTDTNCNMKYIRYDYANGVQNIYFKRKWTDKDILDYYPGLLSEQDIRSPHRYEFDNCCVQKGDVVADIGAAEGIFALSVIDKARKIFLFECDEEWIEALEMTFAPYKEKVVIVNKYVSDVNSDDEIRFDDFLFSNEVNFIKVDIEGAESRFLAGAAETLKKEDIKIAICTYHNKNDAVEFERLLSDNKFNIKFSEGYMLLGNCPPYSLRKGLIRAAKTVFINND